MTEQLKREMSVRDVERLTGVSKATVSRFLNSGHDISLSTAKKLLPVLSKCPCCDRADTRSSLSHVSREEILQHLDLSQNHEAGLIPMATQILLQKIADAILPHIGGVVTVKPLVWVESPQGVACIDADFVDTSNLYCISACVLFIGHTETGLPFDTVEEAKAAAQADYERRILSALTPASEPDTGNTDPMTIAKYDDELRKARPAPVWRDMDSAPKDGTPILIVYQDDVYPAVWGNGELVDQDYPWGVICSDGEYNAIAEGQPTHWMPLPAAPGSQPDPVAEAAQINPGAIEALSAYQQADQEGIMVLVSRQAIEECLPALRSLAAKGGE